MCVTLPSPCVEYPPHGTDPPPPAPRVLADVRVCAYAYAWGCACACVPVCVREGETPLGGTDTPARPLMYLRVHA